jgi:hypothetical protein
MFLQPSEPMEEVIITQMIYALWLQLRALYPCDVISFGLSDKIMLHRDTYQWHKSYGLDLFSTGMSIYEHQWKRPVWVSFEKLNAIFVVFKM